MPVFPWIVVLLLLIWLYRRYRWASHINQLPGMGKSPLGLIGDFTIVQQMMADRGGDAGPRQNALRFMTGLTKVIPNNGLIKTWFGPMANVYAVDADHVEAILSSNDLITKSGQYKLVHSWLGNGLLTSGGDKWRKNRKLLTPSFHFKILEQFVPVMSRNGKILVQRLEQEAFQNNGLIRDLSQFILPCALDVICETAMGQRIDAQSHPDGEYIKAVYTISEIVMERSMVPWLYNDFVFNLTSNGRKHAALLKTLHGFTDSVIKERMQEMRHSPDSGSDSESKSREPFMDTLIREHFRDPAAFTESNIREEVDTFMFEGHDTTAWGVIWATYLLGLHPGCQQQVQQEVDDMFADKNEDEDLTLDEIRTGLKYTEAVVKEAQRLYPSVPLFNRVALTDTKIVDTEVPAGTIVNIVPTFIHHNDKYWSEPQRFKPERFLSGERRHPFAFIPFSAGPRNCIGQKFAMLKEKALIAKIFRMFNVTSLDQRDLVVPSLTMILKPSIPIRVKLEVRNI